MSDQKCKNPWKKLGNEPPFIHPDDKEILVEFNRRRGEQHNHFLHFDILPEPFVGSRSAPILLLSNNPGYASEENAQERRTPKFMIKMRINLLHKPLDCPFVFLDPTFDGAYGQIWWKRKSRDLIGEFSIAAIAKAVLNVTYFPYASRRSGHSRVAVSSASYSFKLVREAIERRAAIVKMRTGKHLWQQWLNVVPELDGYSKLV